MRARMPILKKRTKKSESVIRSVPSIEERRMSQPLITEDLQRYDSERLTEIVMASPRRSQTYAEVLA